MKPLDNSCVSDDVVVGITFAKMNENDIHKIHTSHSGGITPFKAVGIPQEEFIACPFCREAADAHGDHFLCKKYQFHFRHQERPGGKKSVERERAPQKLRTSSTQRR